MLQLHSLAQAKKTARSLEKALGRIGVQLPHGHALDALARMAGYEDFNGLSHLLSEEGIDQKLHAFELQHIEENDDVTYGKEVALVAHTGFQLRYSDTDELCDYVRVCDPLGREVAYWVSDEWEQDPQVVMGAMLGALVRGTPVEIKAFAPSRKLAVVPRTSDIDFHACFCVLINGQRHHIRWRHDEFLKFVADPRLIDTDSDVTDEIALDLAYLDENDFVETVYLTVGDLVGMRWDPKLQVFLSDDKQTRCEFYFEQTMADWARQHLRRKPVSKDPASAEVPKALGLYAVTGEARPRRGVTLPVSTRVIASSVEDAKSRIRSMFGRLHGVVSTPVYDQDAKAFTLYKDGAAHVTFECHEVDSEAIVSHAQRLAEHATDEVTVEDADGNSLWTVKGTALNDD